ncbi:MAG: ArnT family glycosyltransferase, partial [Anaerolineae bacterium]
MNRSRAGLALKLALAIVFAGIGHSFVAFQRDVYPLDGYVYYAAAVIAFIWALRSARDLPGADWSTWREPLKRIAVELRRLASTALDVRFGPALLVGVITLNLISAVLALLIGSWLAFAGWGISAIWFAAVVWPRRAHGTAEPTRHLAPSSETLVEAEETLTGGSPRAAGVIVGVLAVVLGQVMVAIESTSDAFGVIGSLAGSIAEALRLALPGDSAPAMIGLAVLIIGAVVFGAATRHVVLADRPRLIVEARPATNARWGSRWLALVVAGLVLWLVVVQSVAGGGTGVGPAALWIVALVLIGAAWRKIDLGRGVRLGISVERREVYGLTAMLIAIWAVWLFQLDRLPASIWGDEGAYWVFARDLASAQFPVNVFGLGTYSYPAGGSVYQSIWLSLFEPTVWSWRVGSVIAVIASSAPLYFLARSLVGKRVAFVALAFFASSPVALAYGRIGYLYALSIFPVVASAAFSVAAVQRDSRFYAFLAGVTSGVGFMLYP